MSLPSPEQLFSKPNGVFPNSRFPVLVYRSVIPGGGETRLQTLFRDNGWYNNWRYPGVLRYHHFHSTTHECLGVACGWTDVELFGHSGPRLRVEAGDVVVIPAGVAHRSVADSNDIMLVGGYPDGHDWDSMQEKNLTEELRRAAVKRIMMCPVPAKDPATGNRMLEWIDAPSSVDAGLNDFRDQLEP